MKVRTCDERAVLEPCLLEGYAFQVDPYIGCHHQCLYCYGLNEAETDWSKEILIHEDLVDQLDRELTAIGPQPVYVGWLSDPYQPAEKTTKQTRATLELLADHGCSVCLLSKSDLVTRDIDLLQRMPGSSAGISLAFDDEVVRQQFELGAPPNEKRIDALRQLREAGIETYALVCPVVPHLTDPLALIEQVAPHADTVWVYPLSVESEEERAWQNVASILDTHHPHVRAKVEEIVFSSDHEYWLDLLQELEELRTRRNLHLRIEI